MSDNGLSLNSLQQCFCSLIFIEYFRFNYFLLEQISDVDVDIFVYQLFTFDDPTGLPTGTTTQRLVELSEKKKNNTCFRKIYFRSLSTFLIFRLSRTVISSRKYEKLAKRKDILYFKKGFTCLTHSGLTLP